MKKVSKLSGIEKNWLSYVVFLFPMVAFSGMVTYYFPGEAIWRQWTYLLHAFSGVFLGTASLPYLIYHFRRTLGIRRPWVSLSGIALVLVILCQTASGLHIMIAGQEESFRWVLKIHVISAHLVLALLAVHLILHRILVATSNRIEGKSRNFQLSGIAILVSVLTVGGATAIYSFVPSPYRDEAKIKPYQWVYGQHPFRPSQTETISGSFIDARRIAGSDQCGTCHPQIAEQWKASIHSQAASDRAYVKNINLLAQKKGMAATRYCEGCHAPVALLSGQLTEGGFHGGKANTLANQEGVGCMSCHGVDQVRHVKGVGSFLFAPKKEVLFADQEISILKKIHNFLIKIQPEAHRRDMARPPLSSSQLCATCHAQFMDKELNKWGWIKMQDEYTAWLNSPFSGQSEQNFAHQSILRCQDCHMPLVSGDDPSADHNGQFRSHFFPGANTVIPWLNGDHEHLKRTQEFLQSGKLRVSIETPRRIDATRSRSISQDTVRFEAEPPAYFNLGDKVKINVSLSNIGVGHDFPGGTLDLNEAWLWFRVADAENHIIFESGGLSAGNEIDPSAHFYRSIPIDRQRMPVWQHDLFNMVGESFRNVITAGETDIVKYEFSIPYWANGPFTISAVLRYRKFNNRYARWALDDESLLLPITDLARDALVIPLRMKPVLE
ncbi:MAG: cytochrome c family protein [SAR324 cluster bacterium]|nr:cytochrome c family protein [SAR324 cluster bacterium]